MGEKQYWSMIVFLSVACTGAGTPVSQHPLLIKHCQFKVIMQPATQDMACDEHGKFPIYGKATFVVAFDRAQHHFYEVCEAIWAHWMQLQHENPDLDADNVFYWLDVFAFSPEEARKPLEPGDVEKVCRVSRHMH